MFLQKPRPHSFTGTLHHRLPTSWFHWTPRYPLCFLILTPFYVTGHRTPETETSSLCHQRHLQPCPTATMQGLLLGECSPAVDSPGFWIYPLLCCQESLSLKMPDSGISRTFPSSPSTSGAYCWMSCAHATHLQNGQSKPMPQSNGP